MHGNGYRLAASCAKPTEPQGFFHVMREKTFKRELKKPRQGQGSRFTVQEKVDAELKAHGSKKAPKREPEKPRQLRGELLEQAWKQNEAKGSKKLKTLIFCRFLYVFQTSRFSMLALS